MKLTLDDVDDALALSQAEGWNQTAADWRRLIELEPDGCFAARDADRLVGTVTTTAYGLTLAWIGMMIVHPDQRRRGIGAALMRRALDHLRDRRIPTVKLDATPGGRPLYESLGFVAELELERWQGTARRPAEPRGAGSGNIGTQSLIDLDRAAYGIDRARLIDSLAKGSAAKAIAHVESHTVGGFALARRGQSAVYLGPIIAPTSRDAEWLLDAVIAHFEGEAVCLDRHTGGHLSADAAAARGLTKRRVLVRMRYGEPNDAGTAPSICAIAGPEYG